jgi:hypothetical protein
MSRVSRRRHLFWDYIQMLERQLKRDRGSILNNMIYVSVAMKAILD